MNTKTYTQTETVILEMLTENTGRNMLDSGGAYGRNWERNQAKGFDALADAPAVTFENEPSLSLFHYLKEHLTFSAALDAAWQEFDNARPDGAWRENLEEFFDQLGVASEEDSDTYSGRWELNTYNHEYSLLAQVIQYSFFDMNGLDFVALQIHGGCDVRGGYTKPRIFRLDTGRDDLILNSETASVSCSSCGVCFDYRAGEIEVVTDHADGETEKIENMDSREISNHFWDYEKGKFCPNCNAENTISGGF
jgi:hypothetical protein